MPIDTSTADLVTVTLRQVVRVSAAGSAIRLRLSNERGVDALTIGAMHVGIAGSDYNWSQRDLAKFDLNAYHYRHAGAGKQLNVEAQ